MKHPKETVTCLTLLDGVVTNRREERRVVYTGKTGDRFVMVMRRAHALNQANEYTWEYVSIRPASLP